MRLTPKIILAQSFSRSERGATAIEYAMIMCFVFLAIVGAVTAVGQTVVSVFYNKLATLF